MKWPKQMVKIITYYVDEKILLFTVDAAARLSAEQFIVFESPREEY